MDAHAPPCHHAQCPSPNSNFSETPHTPAFPCRRSAAHPIHLPMSLSFPDTLLARNPTHTAGVSLLPGDSHTSCFSTTFPLADAFCSCSGPVIRHLLFGRISILWNWCPNCLAGEAKAEVVSLKSFGEGCAQLGDFLCFFSEFFWGGVLIWDPFLTLS